VKEDQVSPSVQSTGQAMAWHCWVCLRKGHLEPWDLERVRTERERDLVPTPHLVVHWENLDHLDTVHLRALGPA